MTIGNIQFGKVDGKTEAEESDFSELFYEKDTYFSDLSSLKKYFIIGRKGTGKTILANYYLHKKEEESDRYFKGIVLDANDYSESKLVEFAEITINKEEKSTFWKYLFLLEIGKQILEINFPLWMKILYSKKLKKLRSVVTMEFYKIKNFTEEEQYSVESELTSTQGRISANASALVTNNFEKRKYYENLEIIESTVMDILKNTKVSCQIFYDDVDQLEEVMEFAEFKDLIKSMMYAIDSINSKMNKVSQSRIFLILRDDLLNIINKESNNLNKLKVDRGISISWTELNRLEPWEHPLMKMILYKIQKSLGEKEEDFELLYNKYFETSKVFEYIMQRTFGRPRDVIQFLTLHKVRTPSSNKFTENELRITETEYSKWFYDEILNELKLVDFELREEIDKLLNIFKDTGKRRLKYMTVRDLNSELDEPVIELSKTIEKMRDLDIIGTQNGSGNINFSYRSSVSFNISEHSKILIHNGLVKCFSL